MPSKISVRGGLSPPNSRMSEFYPGGKYQHFLKTIPREKLYAIDKKNMMPGKPIYDIFVRVYFRMGMIPFSCKNSVSKQCILYQNDYIRPP